MKVDSIVQMDVCDKSWTIMSSLPWKVFPTGEVDAMIWLWNTPIAPCPRGFSVADKLFEKWSDLEQSDLCSIHNTVLSTAGDEKEVEPR